MKTKKYCKKCNNIINKNELNSHGLCTNCYKNYLLTKIENAKKEKLEQKENSNCSKKFINFIKNIF